MQLDKKSRLYRFAYYNTPEKREPSKASLCRFFWRIVGMALLTVIYVIIVLVFGILFYLTSILVLIFGGLRPIWLFSKDDREKEQPSPWKTISWWPRWRGHYVVPIVVLSPFIGVAALASLLYWVLPALVRGVAVVYDSSLYSMIFFGILVAILVVVGLLFFFNSDAWQLTKAFIKAKKEKICPIINFVDDTTNWN